MVRSLGYYIKINMVIKHRRNGTMNNQIKTVLKKMYEAEIEDAK